MKKIISLILTLVLLLSVMPGVSFAQQTGKINKDNIEEYVERANKGDKEAIEEIQKFKALNKKEVKKVINNIVVASNEEKTIDFDDGSSIVLGSGKGASSEVSAQVGYYDDYKYYSVMAFGLELGRYTIWYSYQAPNETNYVVLTDHYDTASDTVGVDVTANGTTAITSSGTYVRVRGTGEVSSWFAQYTVIGNAYGYANPTYNYATWVTN